MAVRTRTDMLKLATDAGRGNLRSIADAIRALSVGEPYLINAGNPNGVVTPTAIGQHLFDTTNLRFFVATNLTNLGWATTGGAVSALSPAGTIVAAGSVQGNATAILHTLEKVTGADGTKGVIIPNLAVGGVVEIANTAAAILKVYGTGNATINGGSAAAAISMAASSAARFWARTTGDTSDIWTTPRVPS